MMTQCNDLKYMLRKINLHQVDISLFTNRFVGCLVLTKDNKIALQQRREDWKSYPGFLSEFGGHIEKNEEPSQALIRELKEELGAQVNLTDVISLGTISVAEETAQTNELVYGYFWHDRLGTITGCYEGDVRYYTDLDEIFHHPKVMLSTQWLITACKNRRLLK